MGYSPSMILLPLLVASALPSDPNVQTRVYRDCVVGKATEWAGGPDPAQVLVRTAEGVCDGQLQDLKIALVQLTMDQEKSGRKLPPGVTPREFVDTAAGSVVEGVRSLAFARVLEARSKKP